MPGLYGVYNTFLPIFVIFVVILISYSLFWYFVFISTIAFLAFTVIKRYRYSSTNNMTINLGLEKSRFRHNLFQKMENGRIKLSHVNKYEQNIQSPEIIVSRMVDTSLKQVLVFFVRDYIFYYIREIVHSPDDICEDIVNDLLFAVNRLKERLSKIDYIKLIACDIVSKITEHLEKIRQVNPTGTDTDKMQVSEVFQYKKSYSEEEMFLRNFSEVLLVLLLPKSYSLTPIKYLIRDCLVFKMFLPLINQITDPDFINEYLIFYIEYKKSSPDIYKEDIECAKTNEEFSKIITKTSDFDVIDNIRGSIVEHIMQMTNVQNLHWNKSVNVDNGKGNLDNSGVNRSDINTANKLKRYIHELAYTKRTCDKRCSDLDGLNWKAKNHQEEVVPLKKIMENTIGRKYLSQFLETMASQNLIRFWSAINELKNAPKKSWHQFGAEIYYTFIRDATSEMKTDKNTKKKIEDFLLGNSGPEVFYEIQDEIVDIIVEKYYQPFLLSDFYKDMMKTLKVEDVASDLDSNQLWEDKISKDLCSLPDASCNVGDHNNYARKKLNELDEKCVNKFQALQALRLSLKPNSKILNILEKEVDWLNGEKRQLEAHINRTEIWGENLGRWRAVVQSVEIPDEKEPPQFVLVVHMMENDEETMEGEESVSTGWVVCRNLCQFQELHKHLKTMCAELKSLDLPSSQTFKFPFGKTEKISMEKAKQQIQRYLDFVLKEEKLNQSESIYSFLSPSSDHLKRSTPSPKKNKFSLSSLLKDFRRASGEDDYGNLPFDDCLPVGDDKKEKEEIEHQDSSSSKKSPTQNDDTIAEHLYALLGEIFDLGGLFKYLRKTLIAFVQLSYGSTINRQIRERIEWCFSEQMLHFYLSQLLNKMWPDGAEMTDALRHDDDDNQGRTEDRDERLERAHKAKRLLLDNLPEVLTSLVGTTAAKNGIEKVFNVFQNKQFNRHLLYEIMEVVTDVIFPELIEPDINIDTVTKE